MVRCGMWLRMWRYFLNKIFYRQAKLSLYPSFDRQTKQLKVFLMIRFLPWAHQMRHFILAAVIISLLAACATKPPDDIGNACEIFRDKKGWYKATRKVEKKWKMPIAVQLAIIHQESSFKHDVRPARKKFLFVFPGRRPSSAYGYAQALDTTWDNYRKETGRRGADRDNFKDAVDFIGWYGDLTRRRAGVSPSDAYNQYLAYHEGQTGFIKGTYRKKPQVRRIAKAVAQNAARYDAQLSRCEREFRRGIPFIPFI